MSDKAIYNPHKNRGELRELADRFTQFHTRYTAHFQSKTRSVFEAAASYIKGLMQGEPGKRNMERMASVIPDSNEQALNHMISDSAWSADGVYDQVALDADRLLGGTPGSALLIDESGIKKSGTASVGVSRQWLGRIGKVDNGQVGVFAALARGKRATLVDCRLYLPEKWTEDPDRCEKAGVPKESRTFKSKSQLALEMVAHQRKIGVRFGFVGADGGYGKEPAFLRGLDDMGEIFMVDVHSDQRIFLAEPQPFVPTPKQGRGRKPSRYVTKATPIEVKDWAALLSNEAWVRLSVGDGSQGEMVVEVLHSRVWLWDKTESQARCWHLLIRREVGNHNEIKYSLSNAPEDTSLQTLANMQAQRYWIERAFEDAKSECGMAEYQVRKWQGWHHHMALVLMTMLFMLEERIRNEREIPLLSCFDIRQLLVSMLPKRNLDPNEVMLLLSKRHKKRANATRAAAKLKGASGYGFASG